MDVTLLAEESAASLFEGPFRLNLGGGSLVLVVVSMNKVRAVPHERK